MTPLRSALVALFPYLCLAIPLSMFPMLGIPPFRGGRSRLMTGWLLLVSAAVLAFGVGAVVDRWWPMILMSVFLGLVTAVVWDQHLAARARRLPYVVVWVIRLMNRGASRGSRRRRMLSLPELRAEYAQNVLDDAAHDPDLALVLLGAGNVIEQTLLKDKPAGTRLSQEELVGYANGVLDGASSPGYRVPAQSYRNYSPVMLTVAALCQLAERQELTQGR